jgi:hypothetical protein
MQMDVEEGWMSDCDDVWLERPTDQHGAPISAVAFGGHDDGLWRVVSQKHGMRIVIGRAEALSIARRLVAQSGGRVSMR